MSLLMDNRIIALKRVEKQLSIEFITLNISQNYNNSIENIKTNDEIAYQLLMNGIEPNKDAFLQVSLFNHSFLHFYINFIRLLLIF